MERMRRGERGGPQDRVLFSVSQQLDGGWLCTQIVSRTTWVQHELPSKKGLVHSMGQGHGGRSDCRQTQLWDDPEWLTESLPPTSPPPLAAAETLEASKEEGCVEGAVVAHSSSLRSESVSEIQTPSPEPSASQSRSPREVSSRELRSRSPSTRGKKTGSRKSSRKR